MADLAGSMPALKISTAELKKWGTLWLSDKVPKTNEAKKPRAFNKEQGVRFTKFLDQEVAKQLATMLGGIPVVQATGKTIRPSKDCVEWGAVRVVGGVRPQNFDVAYRPDGPRIAFDSKTLNDLKSVGKNWQNMVNDLATEAATVHTRFPYAIVAFIVVIPKPALGEKQQADIIRTLERLASRATVLDQTHLAEVISVVIWDPATGGIDPGVPPKASVLRVEEFSKRLHPHYLQRYKGLPPHDQEAGVNEADEQENNGEELDQNAEDKEELPRLEKAPRPKRKPARRPRR